MHGRGRDGTLSSGHHQLVKATDDIARGVQPRHTGAAVGVHVQVATGVHVGAQWFGKVALRRGAHRYVEHVEAVGASVAQLQRQAAVAQGVRTAGYRCKMPHRGAGRGAAVAGRMRHSHERDVRAVVAEEPRLGQRVFTVPQHHDVLAGVFMGVADRAMAQQPALAQERQALQRWFVVDHAGGQHHLAHRQLPLADARNEAALAVARQLLHTCRAHDTLHPVHRRAHPRQQGVSSDAVRKTGQVVGAVDAQRAALPGVDEQHPAVKAPQVKRGRQACRTTADHEAVDVIECVRVHRSVPGKGRARVGPRAPECACVRVRAR